MGQAERDPQARCCCTIQHCLAQEAVNGEDGYGREHGRRDGEKPSGPTVYLICLAVAGCGWHGADNVAIEHVTLTDAEDR